MKTNGSISQTEHVEHPEPPHECRVDDDRALRGDSCSVLVQSPDDSVTRALLAFLRENSLGERSDVRFITKHACLLHKKGSLGFFSLIARLWTIREDAMLEAFIGAGTTLYDQSAPNPSYEHGINVVARMGDAQVRCIHHPRRNFENYFKPSKIIDTWSHTRFAVVAESLVALFDGTTGVVNQDDALAATLSTRKNMRGVGEYGAANLVRMCFHAMGVPMPGSTFLPMSKCLDGVWRTLRDVYGVTDCDEFNAAFGTDLDPGGVSYAACMFFRPYWGERVQRKPELVTINHLALSALPTSQNLN
jgi:hypothetical protein